MTRQHRMILVAAIIVATIGLSCIVVYYERIRGAREMLANQCVTAIERDRGIGSMQRQQQLDEERREIARQIQSYAPTSDVSDLLAYVQREFARIAKRDNVALWDISVPQATQETIAKTESAATPAPSSLPAKGATPAPTPRSTPSTSVDSALGILPLSVEMHGDYAYLWKAIGDVRESSVSTEIGQVTFSVIRPDRARPMMKASMDVGVYPALSFDRDYHLAVPVNLPMASPARPQLQGSATEQQSIAAAAGLPGECL